MREKSLPSTGVLTSLFVSVFVALGGLGTADVSAQQGDPFAQVDALVRKAKANGYVTPDIWSAFLGHREPVYEEHHLREVLDLIDQAPPDDCVRAVVLALFLDAHVRKIPDMFADGTAQKLFGIWIMKGGWDVLAKLTKNWSNVVDVPRKVILTWQALAESSRQAVAQNRALWVQEIVQRALSNDWDEARVQSERDQLYARAAKYAAEIDEMLLLTQRRQNEAIAQRDAAYAAADAAFRDGYIAIFGPDDPDVPQLERQITNAERLKILENVRDDAKAVADRRLGEDLDRIEEIRSKEVAKDMLEIAKARLQERALAHYVQPILRGNCADIAQVMPLTDSVAPPPPPDTPDPQPPMGGHWALTDRTQEVTMLSSAACEDARGTVDDGSARLSISRGRCDVDTTGFEVAFDWTPLPPFLLPGEEFEVVARISGTFEGQTGSGRLEVFQADTDYACKAWDREDMALAWTTDDGRLSVKAGLLDRAEGSAFVIGPDQRLAGSKRWVQVCAFDLGRADYVYEWRDGAVPEADTRRIPVLPATPAPASPGLSAGQINDLLTGQ